MTKIRFGSLTLLLALSWLSTSIRAELIQATDPRYGPDSLTLDTESGLAWLDLPLSAGLSYEQLLLATAPGGQFAGFRLATVPEVLSLYSHAGIPGTGWFPATSPSLLPILSLINLLGPTSSQDGNPETIGITATPGFFFGRLVPGLDYLGGTEPGYMLYGSPEQMLIYGETTGSPGVGAWLVTPIPEPETWMIASLGALVLMAYSRVSLRRGKGG